MPASRKAFLGLLVIIALATSPVWRRLASFGGNVPRRALAIFGIVISGFIYGQLALGATMRHQHRDLAILDFPLAYGQIIPADRSGNDRPHQPGSRRASTVRCVGRSNLAANGASVCRGDHWPDNCDLLVSR